MVRRDYLNQCRFNIDQTYENKRLWNLDQNITVIKENDFKMSEK